MPLYGTDRFAADPGSLRPARATAARSVLEARTRSGAGSGDDASGLDAAAALGAFAITAPAVRTGTWSSAATASSRARPNAPRCAKRLPDALAVEMEGAALAQVCHDLAVPFAVVRTISDRADNSAHVDFGRFVASIASRYSVAIVRRFLRDCGAGAPS